MAKNGFGSSYKSTYKRRKPYVPGYGGMVGRFVGAARSAYTTKGSTANWMLKKVKHLADIVNAEYKYFDTAAALSTIDYTGSLASQIPIPQGTTDVTRIGDSVKIQTMTFRFFLQRNGADSIVRVIVLWDPQNKISSTADVLQNVGTSAAPLQPKNYDKRFQCSFLMDKSFAISSNNSIIKYQTTIPINKHTQYNGGTTTINTGDLKVFLISNNSTNLPLITYFARVSYTDN